MREREMIAPTRRRSMHKKRRVGIFLAHGGKCELCGRKIVDGERWEIEHRIALDLGGPDDDANCYPVHVKCHRGKTAADRKAIAARDRAVDRGYAGKKVRNPIGNPRLKRRMDGTVVDRETGEPVNRR